MLPHPSPGALATQLGPSGRIDVGLLLLVPFVVGAVAVAVGAAPVARARRPADLQQLVAPDGLQLTTTPSDLTPGELAGAFVAPQSDRRYGLKPGASGRSGSPSAARTVTSAARRSAGGPRFAARPTTRTAAPPRATTSSASASRSSACRRACPTDSSSARVGARPGRPLPRWPPARILRVGPPPPGRGPRPHPHDPPPRRSTAAAAGRGVRRPQHRGGRDLLVLGAVRRTAKAR